MANEDLSTYTLVNPNAVFTVTSSKSLWTNMNQSVSDYLYADKTVGFFGSTFIHSLNFRLNSPGVAGNSLSQPWCLGNTIANGNGFGSSQSIAFQLEGRTAGNIRIGLEQNHNGTTYDSPQDTSLTMDTDYYAIIQRTTAGTNGTVTMYVYSNSNFTGLLVTLTLALGVNDTWRYVYAGQSFNNGGGSTGQTAYVQTLNLSASLPATNTGNMLLVF